MSSAATGFIANFNTGLGKYDGSSLYGVSTSQDISGAVVGSSNLNLVNGYVLNPNSFVLPSALSGANAGFTVTGWFNTSNTTIKSTIVDLSCTAPSTGNIVVNISGGVLYGNYPGAAIFAAAGSVVTGGWNFFTYSVCASGGTQLVQSMYVNGTQSMLSNGGGSYVAYTVGNMFIGYGAAPYTQYLNAKVDDFRYYGRVLTPMEIRILHQYTYNNGMYSGAGGSGGALIPSLGTAPIYTGIKTVSIATLTTTSAISFALTNTGTYSHLKVARYLNGTLNANYTVSSASQPLSGGIVKSTALIPSGGGSGSTVSYTWNDICYNTGNVSGYTYSFTPVVMGSYGAASDFIACV